MKNKSIKFLVVFLNLLFLVTTIYLQHNPGVNENFYYSDKEGFTEKPMSSYLDLFGLGGKKLGVRGGEYPKICSDDQGGAIICFESGRIFAQRINATGELQWIESGIAVSQSLNYIASPDICKDGYGGAIIVWNGGNVWDNKDIYANKINSTGHLQWSIKAICTAAGVQASPQICSDGTGGAIIMWRDYRSGPDPAHELCDIYAQRVNSTGHIQWTHNGVLISDTGSYMNSVEEFPKIMSDREEGAIISWYDGGNIYAQKINSSGEIQWASNGLVVCNAEGTQKYPTMCTDESGGAFFAWVDMRPPYSFEEDIYAQRINSTGHAQWAHNGIAVISKEKWQRDVKMCEDGEGNAILAWLDTDYISPTDYPTSVYVQKLSPEGNFYWGQQALSLGETPNTSPHFQMSFDGTGGAFIAWLRKFGSNQTICLQNVDSNGTINWRDGGFIMKNVFAREFTMTNDNSGGCIIAWDSYLIDEYKIFIQKVLNECPKPFSNHPPDIITTNPATEKISWIIQSESGEGQYQVITNDTNGNNVIWVNWTVWQHNISIIIDLNHLSPGFYFYKIEYFDNHSQLGLPDTVLVKIESQTQSPSILGFNICLIITFLLLLTSIIAKHKKTSKID